MQIISLVPEREIEFRRPFTSVVKQTMSIKNTSTDTFIAFKVKTTAPKQYCVRPNSGLIGPGESQQVQVLLQAMKQDPPHDLKCKDKFLIQAIKIPKETSVLESEALANRLAELWKQVEAIKKEDANAAAEIMEESKLKVVFAGANGDRHFSGAAPATETSFDTFSKKEAEYQQATSTLEEPGTHSPVGSTQEIPKTSKELIESKETIKKLTMAIDGYRSEIDRLNALRQRKVLGTASESISTPTVAQQYQQPGLPIQMVALVALISFIVGALLF